jgi:hypothetical protein
LTRTFLDNQEGEAAEYADNSRIIEQELPVPPSVHTEISAPEGQHEASGEQYPDPRTGTTQDARYTYLEMLRTTHEAMVKQLAETDISPDEIFAAQDLLSSMGGLLNNKLRSRLHRQGG